MLQDVGDHGGVCTKTQVENQILRQLLMNRFVLDAFDLESVLVKKMKGP